MSMRDRNRLINDAIERQLSPEAELVLARNKESRNLVWLLATAAIVLVAFFTLSFTSSIAQTDSTLKAYFGENVWREVRKSQDNPSLLHYIFIGVFVAVISVFGISAGRTARRKRELEDEILAHIKGGKKGG